MIQFLERVNQILQVNVFPVGLYIGQKEIIEPFPNLALEHKRQHRSRQLQEEDEANDSREKLKEADVFPESPNTPSKSQNESDCAHNKHPPNWVKTM